MIPGWRQEDQEFKASLGYIVHLKLVSLEYKSFSRQGFGGQSKLALFAAYSIRDAQRGETGPASFPHRRTYWRAVRVMQRGCRLGPQQGKEEPC